MARYTFRPTQYIELRADGSRGHCFRGAVRKLYAYRVVDRQMKFDDSEYPIVVYPEVYVTDLRLLSEFNPEFDFGS